jgi:hypothetical protein
MPTERDIEREEVECVFGLTGGELADESWAGHKYWYEGIPDYAGEDFTDEYAEEVRYRTIVCCYLFSSPPEKLESDEGSYCLAKTYANSGETTCPGHSDQDNAGQVVEEMCPLCEMKKGEAHGYIHLGDGWAEAVYRLEIKTEEEDG